MTEFLSEMASYSVISATIHHVKNYFDIKVIKSIILDE